MANRRPPAKRRQPARPGKPLRGYVLPSEKEERQLRRVRWRRLLVGLGLVAVIVGALVLYQSPLLRVQEVEVVGAQHVDPQQVLALADLEGHSILKAPLDKAERRIAALPLVKAAEASRVFPNKVRITVTERVAWGYWQIGDKPYVIDSEAVVLDGVAPGEGALTILDTTTQNQLVAGDRVDAEAVALAQRLGEAVPGAFQLGVARFEYSSGSGLTLVTSADYRVVIGDSQNLEYKLAAWQALEQKLGREAMTGHVLDLRFGDRPSFR